MVRDGASAGRVVRVLRHLGAVKFKSGRTHSDCWLLEGRLAEVCLRAQQLGGDAIQPDANLRPLRDPGEDARDETLEWLPVPQIERTKESA